MNQVSSVIRRLSTGRTKLSNDLLLSASMGYAGKKQPNSHTEHLKALNSLNLYDDARIELSIDRIKKADFC